MIVLLYLFMATHVLSGNATHYGCGWNGRTGASGITVNCHDPIAAHKTLPFGTIVKVVNDDPNSKHRGESTTVMIFDRGPYGKGRVVDMMPYSLWDIAGKKAGGLKVKIVVTDTRYQCSGYKCLPKKLGTTRMTDKKLLELIAR